MVKGDQMALDQDLMVVQVMAKDQVLMVRVQVVLTVRVRTVLMVRVQTVLMVRARTVLTARVQVVLTVKDQVNMGRVHQTEAVLTDRTRTVAAAAATKEWATLCWIPKNSTT
jgi:hypothetical protein